MGDGTASKNTNRPIKRNSPLSFTSLNSHDTPATEQETASGFQQIRRVLTQALEWGVTKGKAAETVIDTWTFKLTMGTDPFWGHRPPIAASILIHVAESSDPGDTWQLWKKAYPPITEYYDVQEKRFTPKASEAFDGYKTADKEEIKALEKKLQAVLQPSASNAALPSNNEICGVSLQAIKDSGVSLGDIYQKSRRMFVKQAEGQ